MIAPEIVLFMCGVVALCSATCIPAQSEWQQVYIGGYADDKRHGLSEEFAVVSYDAINNRSAALATIRNGTTEQRLKIVTISDHSLRGKQYVLDLTTYKCNIFHMVLPFQHICVPAYAKRVGTFTLGLSGALHLTSYEIHHADPRDLLSVQEIDGNTYVPVSETIYGKLEQTPVELVASLEFSNFTLGIKNVSVFDIPAECKHADESSFLKQPIRHHHFIMAI